MPAPPLLVLPLLGVGAITGAIVALVDLSTTWSLIVGIAVIAAGTSLVLLLLMGIGPLRSHTAEGEDSGKSPRQFVGVH
jgi:hypothetical protein